MQRFFREAGHLRATERFVRKIHLFDPLLQARDRVRHMRQGSEGKGLSLRLSRRVPEFGDVSPICFALSSFEPFPPHSEQDQIAGKGLPGSAPIQRKMGWRSKEFGVECASSISDFCE